MKTAVVTGATSFLGRNTVEGLLAASYQVYAYVREDSPNLKLLPEHENLRLIYGDLSKMKSLSDDVPGADVFLHFAWDGSGDKGRGNDEVQQKNAVYAMDALEVAEKLGCRRFVFPGSQAEYGITEGPVDENVSCNPVSPYGKAKYAFSLKAQEFCAEKGMNYLHMRIFSVYGFGDRRGTLVDDCIRKFSGGQTMEMGPCNQLWNYLYIDDFVRILLALLSKKQAEGIVNVAGGDTRPLREYVMEIYEVTGGVGKYRFGDAVSKPEGTPVLCPDTTKLHSLIGDFEQTSFRQGIRWTMQKMEEMEE